MTIHITKEENELFSLLIDFINQTQIGTGIRVNGGWVRDKLLGQNSDDIDIALDGVTGKRFAMNLKEWLLNTASPIRIHVAIINLNPGQSKHLETAKVNLLGFEIDFVNLRSETYTDTSRIPDVEIGTPYEDAMRRDFTINALFYNLMTKKIEDYTSRGLTDLENGIIRTPYDPVDTFLDDPLRSLRAIRFACQLNFSLTTEIVDACKKDVLIEALLNKVSKERIGIEVDKMFASKSPSTAAHLLLETGLCAPVFKLPEDCGKLFSTRCPYPWFTRLVDTLNARDMGLDTFTGSDRSNWYIDGLNCMSNVPSLLKIWGGACMTLGAKLEKVLFYSSVLYPLSDLRVGKNSLSAFAIVKLLKRSKKEAEMVASVQKCASSFIQLFETDIINHLNLLSLDHHFSSSNKSVSTSNSTASASQTVSGSDAELSNESTIFVVSQLIRSFSSFYHKNVEDSTQFTQSNNQLSHMNGSCRKYRKLCNQNETSVNNTSPRSYSSNHNDSTPDDEIAQQRNDECKETDAVINPTCESVSKIPLQNGQIPITSSEPFDFQAATENSTVFKHRRSTLFGIVKECTHHVEDQIWIAGLCLAAILVIDRYVGRCVSSSPHVKRNCQFLNRGLVTATSYEDGPTQLPNDAEVKGSDLVPLGYSFSDGDIRNVIFYFQSLYDEICEKEILDAVKNLKLFFDGNKLLELFPRLTKGPRIKELIEKQTQWMVDNLCIGSDGCLTYLKGVIESWN